MTQLLHCRENAFGVSQQKLSRRGQCHSGGMPLEKNDAQAFFERFDLSGQRGLAQMQRLGRSRQVTMLGYSDKRL